MWIYGIDLLRSPASAVFGTFWVGFRFEGLKLEPYQMINLFLFSCETCVQLDLLVLNVEIN